VREKARKDIHGGKIKFMEWVESQGGSIDTSKSPRTDSLREN